MKFRLLYLSGGWLKPNCFNSQSRVNMRIAGGTFVWILRASLLITFVVGLSEDCSCKTKHPQEHFCSADYVIRVAITGQKKCEEDVVGYFIELQEVFKMTDKASVHLSLKILWTPAIDHSCRAVLEGTQYVIAAKLVDRQLRLQKCHLAIEWHDVTEEQKKGFRGFYERGCQCEIKNRTYSSNQCQWNSKDFMWSCLGRYSYCLPDTKFSNRCTWLNTDGFRKCSSDQKGVWVPPDQSPYYKWGHGVTGV